MTTQNKIVLDKDALKEATDSVFIRGKDYYGISEAVITAYLQSLREKLGSKQDIVRKSAIGLDNLAEGVMGDELVVAEAALLASGLLNILYSNGDGDFQ